MEIQKDNSINFLDIKLVKKSKQTNRNKMASKGRECRNIYCNRRSDVDKDTKRNVIKNLERRVEKLEKQREELKVKLWKQLKKNGYMEKKEEEEAKTKRKKKNKVKKKRRAGMASQA